VYASGGRTADWLKIKTAKRQEVVIAGFTAPRRTRPFFGALDEAVTTWLRPTLVAEVKFAEWTSKGELRQPVYLGP
jgi:bifunctional non-homologous end joining protein LigD